MGNRGQLLFLI